MSLADRLARLGAFADEFGAPGFSMGQGDAFGFGYSKAANRFMQYCHDDDWVDRSFDWPTWKDSAEGQRFTDPAAIRSSAEADDLRRLLTVAIRQERFVEGGLAGWHAQGLLLAIMHRARDLAGG